jgi:hypothetical protein
MKKAFVLNCCTVILFALAPASPGWAQSGGSTPITAAEIVAQMDAHNRERAAALRSYHSLRKYSVEYQGFAAHVAASIEVESSFDAETGKSFRIKSQSGSKMLVEKVLKRLVESEKDATDHHSAQLTTDNYSFRLVGTEWLNGRQAWVLAVDPIRDSTYLYRGKIWIDCAEYALARIEAAPAKSPSFWISSTSIHHEYARNSGYWLPAQNRSESRIRVGGHAVLLIDYGSYEIVPAAQPLQSGQ